MYPKREKNVSLNYITDTVQCANTQEYVFLSAGKFMPGMEKLAGELRKKTSFFLPGINFSAYRIHFPV